MSPLELEALGKSRTIQSWSASDSARLISLGHAGHPAVHRHRPNVISPDPQMTAQILRGRVSVSDSHSCIRTFSCDIRSALKTEDTQPVYLTSYMDSCPPDALFIWKLIGRRSPGEIVREALGLYNGAIYPQPYTPAPDENIFQPHWSPEATFYRAVDLRPSYSFTRHCQYCLVMGGGGLCRMQPTAAEPFHLGLRHKTILNEYIWNV